MTTVSQPGSTTDDVCRLDATLPKIGMPRKSQSINFFDAISCDVESNSLINYNFYIYYDKEKTQVH